MLEETVDAIHLELQIPDALLQSYMPHVRLRVGHLEGHESLLNVLLGLLDAALSPDAALLNLVSQLRHHLLQVLKHGLQSGINVLLLLGMARVLVGI
jgi:hypothetical protein